MPSRSACILLWTSALLAPAAVAQITPLMQDSYFTPGNGLNFGSATTINVGGPNSSAALVQFDLSRLPSGVSVAQATLCVFVSKVGAAGTVNISVANGSWSELTVTGTSAPPVPAAAVASGVPIATANTFLIFDATDAVRNWMNGSAANNGFIITPGNSSINVALDSKESATTSHPATLTITFAGPAGPTGAVGAAGATGAQGPAGPTGATGVKGATGATGSPGATGAQGLQGAGGPAGTNGVSGYQQVTQSTPLPSNNIATFIIGCPSSKVVVGGGVSFPTTGVSGTNLANVQMIQSFPASSTTWETVIANKSAVSFSLTFYAVCVTSGG